MPAALEALERHGEIELDPRTRGKLLKMSASTIDRLLKPAREKYRIRGRSGTKPGTLLKSRIPVRTFTEWNEKRAGFVEIDRVGHDGGCGRGEFLQTLDVTDVHTAWSEQRAVLNKAQKWVFEALLGIDSDNGGEFIDHPLRDYCEEEGITFTRSRPHRKNDTCFVEQKNYSIVRRAAGYGRFVGPRAVERLNALYDLLRLRTNFFLPSMKLIGKKRVGSRVHKQYDLPKTPHRRLTDDPEIPKAVKEELDRLFRRLNPAELDRGIREIQEELTTMVRQVGSRIARPEGSSELTNGNRAGPSPPEPSAAAPGERRTAPAEKGVRRQTPNNGATRKKTSTNDKKKGTALGQAAPSIKVRYSVTDRSIRLYIGSFRFHSARRRKYLRTVLRFSPIFREVSRIESPRRCAAAIPSILSAGIRLLKWTPPRVVENVLSQTLHRSMSPRSPS